MITHKNLFVNTHFPVSRLPSHYDRRYTTYPLKVILKEIQSGNVTIPNTADHITDKTLRGVTKEARRVLALNNPASEAAYQEIKRSMPAISPAGIFDSEGYIQEFSGLAYLDYDTLSDSAFALAVAAKNPHTLAAFRSLRGNRIKVLTHLTPNASDTGLPLNAETHKHAWFTAVLAYEEIGLPDPNGGKPTALSALVHDPDLYVNWNAIPLPWSVDEDALNDYFPNSESETEISALSELPPEYHDAIREMEWKEDSWGKTQLPCPFLYHEHDGWGLRTNGTTVRKDSDNDYTLHCFKCPKTRRYRESPKISTWAEHQTRMLDIIEDAPPVEVREDPSFPHFSKEERILLKSQGLDPDAGWKNSFMSQQIYLPLGGQYPIPYELEANTMQVPRGHTSVLWELRDGNLTAAEAMIYLCMNHGSSWNSGVTWSLSMRYLSEQLHPGMSRSYVQKTVASLNDKGWIETIDEDNPSGNRYRLRHHLCNYEDMPVNRDGKPLKFAVPRGTGGPLERCFDGDISWKAALAWISLKLRSNWKAHADTAGQTESATLLELSKRIRISLPTYQKLIPELTQAGMLERLTPKSQAAIFQLYPKPFPKPVQPGTEIRQELVAGKVIKTDGEYWYSHNWQYRCYRESGEVQRRQRGDTWKRVSDFHKYQEMPQAILRDFDRVIDAKRLVESAVFS